MKKAHTNLQNPFVILLIAAALVIGYLFSRVQSLEQGSSKSAQATDTSADAGSQPPQPQGSLDAMPKITDKDHILGKRDADVLLVEYSDLECPFCKRFHPTMQQALTEYGDKVAWVYRHFPLSFHVNAQKEAEAAECAGELGGNKAFWKYLDTIFERTTSNGTGFALDALVPLAKEIDLNESKFKQCLDSGKYAQHVQDDMAGGAAAGVNGTPGTIIVAKGKPTELIPGALPYDQVKPMIDAALGK